MKLGRKSVFRGKTTRVHGFITDTGAQRFEEARAVLAVITQRERVHVSDGDVVEFLARGRADTEHYLAGK